MLPERTPDRLLQRLEEVLQGGALAQRHDDFDGQAGAQALLGAADLGDLGGFGGRHGDVGGEEAGAGLLVEEAAGVEPWLRLGR